MVMHIAPNIFKPCPHSGRFALKDISVDTKMMSWVPAGIVRFDLRAWNDEDDKMISLSVVTQFDRK